MKNLLGVLVLCLSFSSLAIASNITLTCDGNDFEAPADIIVRGSTASADVSFDVIDDIAEASYKNLDVIDVEKNSDGDIVTLTIVQPTVEGKKGTFRAVLHADDSGKLAGHLSLVSTDGDHLPYSDYVSCSVK